MTRALGCSCCGCSDCGDKQPRRLIVSIEYPEGGGETVAASQEYEYDAVTTNCQPPANDRSIISVSVTSPGYGYTSAPAATPSAGDATFLTEIRAPLAGFVVTNGGSGYTSSPTVSLQGGVMLRSVTANAVILGGATGAVVTAGGSGYTSAPTVFAGTGTGLAATATMSGYYTELTVTNGGDGYTDAPAVVFGGSPQTPASAAAQIRQFVASIAVTNGGSGYTSPPSVSVTGAGGGVVAEAVISDGQVVAINVLSPGNGAQKFFLPFPSLVVTISGGGGSGAAATATPYRPVTSVFLFSGGDGYQPSDGVSFSGGGGSGAEVTGTLLFRVGSVQVGSAGDGYRLNEPLIFTGGGGSGAEGALVVSGSVARVDVSNGGLYRNVRRTDGAETTAWPTASFSGGGGSGAAATPFFAASGIYAVFVDNPGSNYNSAPSISFSGGGGQGAAATANLRWAQSHEVAIDFVGGGCSASELNDFCSETDSSDYPDAPCLGCGGRAAPTAEEPADTVRYGEQVRWSVIASSASPARSASGLDFGGSTNIREFDYTPSGEYVSIYSIVEWSAVGDPASVDGIAATSDERLWVKRLFARIPPTGSWVISSPEQTDDTAVIEPVVKQIEDRAGQLVWWIESFTVVSPGENLFTRPAPFDSIRLRPSAASNAVYPPQELTTNATFTYSPPIVSEFLGPAFSVPPIFSPTFSPGQVSGDYTLTGISVTSPGAGGPDGTWVFTTGSLAAGHYLPTSGYSVPAIEVTIVDGQVTSASVATAGRVRGAASLVSIDLNPVEEYVGFERYVVGRTGQKTATTYSEPTVVASAGSGGAEFAITLSEGEDSAGNPFWSVSKIEITNGGSGYTGPVGLDFDVTSLGGVESIEAVAVASPPGKEEPTLSLAGDGDFSIAYSEIGDAENWTIDEVTITDGGSSYQYGQEAKIVLGEDDVQESPLFATIYTTIEEPSVAASVSSGSGGVLSVTLQATTGGWEVASVSVVAAGTGYTDGEEVIFAGGDQGESGAYAIIQADVTGAITGVSVFFGGVFYSDTGVAESIVISSGGLFHKQRKSLDIVTLVSGGRYYNKLITITDEPLDSVTCNEVVSEENGWELFRYKKPTGSGDAIAVGASFSGTVQAGCWRPGVPSIFYEPMDRTRRCGLPTLSFRFSQ